MVASPRLGKKQNIFDPKVAGEDLPKLLKVAAIYGPNASGKSNLVKALTVIPRLLDRAPGSESSIPVMPFRFDPDLAHEPSHFEVNFIDNNLRFHYRVAATSERIFEETLICYPKGKEHLLYSRIFTQNTGESYTFGELLEGGSIVHEAWKNLTAPQSLFLAQAALNSSQELQQLKNPYQWLLKSNICIGQNGMTTWSLASRSALMKTPEVIDLLESFLQRLDVPITNIRFEENSELDSDKVPNMAPRDYLKWIKKDPNTKLTHSTALGDAEFDYSEESGGTQNLIGFWLPWMYLNMISHGKVVVIDELDSSLHPKIVESLIKEHLAGDKKTQLIFTTHDTHLMNTKLLRRDQFWVTERDVNGATQMFSIHDFQGRDSEDIEKRYYEGRYRGLPILSRS